MPRCLVSLLSLALALLVPAVSLAASDECPDGWFCAPNASPSPAAPTAPAAPTEPPGTGPVPQAADPGSARPASAPGLALTYPDAEGNALGAEKPGRKRRHRFREWGFNLHLVGGLLAEQPERDTALGGLGFAFRYRMIPRLALEAGVELLRGPEHRGHFRTDAALLLNLLVFFNPRDVVQVYAFGGVGLSRTGLTFLDRDSGSHEHTDWHYSYFGGQLGAGLEVRVSQLLAISGDLVGFLRGRTDDEARTSDFVNRSNGFRNDSSSGGLIRGGVTFYW